VARFYGSRCTCAAPIILSEQRVPDCQLTRIKSTRPKSAPPISVRVRVVVNISDSVLRLLFLNEFGVRSVGMKYVS